ncbi:hypothetical protein Y032_0052g2245 [Ancylostoma ceylanicum]|uniref:Uncharacterized protein n=1 Tax=Ancylostoma ceylanicum TaxID=53326 RepID=A0A016U8G8_9BILA|nr:hypothetical protein Y032_0052g2245 [Ancylostoma ceylanicum]
MSNCWDASCVGGCNDPSTNITTPVLDIKTSPDTVVSPLLFLVFVIPDNSVEIKGVDTEEYDHGLLTCKPKEDVCFTAKKTIQQHARTDTIRIYRTGCGREEYCLKGSCCRQDGCNERLYAMMLTDVSALPDFSEVIRKRESL